MASVAKRPDGKWRARYRDAAGREHSKHFPRKVDAERWIATQTADLARGDWIDPRRSRTTFRQYSEAWVAAQVWRPNTSRRVHSALRLHLLPVFGDRALASIRPTEVQAFVKALTRTTAPSTARMLYTVLRGIFRAAVQDRMIPDSPCVRIALPAVAPKELEVPGVLTLRRLHAELPERYRAVVLVATGLGLRPGEVFGLEVGDVDFLRRRVRVARQLDERGAVAPLKTASSHRTVPLPQVVADELARHLASGGQRGGLVFVGEDGSPVRRKTFEAAWRRAVTRCEVPGLRLHDLRHAYASALIAAGESVKVVQLRLGHSSATITLDVYGHLWPDSDDKTRAALDAFLGAPADHLRTEQA